MARKIVSRREKRAEHEAAEEVAKKSVSTEEKAKVKKVAAPKKPRVKKVVEQRVRLFWGVFNQSMKRVALYEYHQKKQAEKKAEELTKAGTKSQHFIQRVKEAVQEG